MVTRMPFTAFHVVPVWPLYVRWPARWNLLALSFGSVMPDLEIVTLYPILQDAAWGRGIMHSLLGVITVNLLLAAFATRVLAPAIALRLDRRYPGKGWTVFAHRDVVRETRSWAVTASSAILGGLTHLAIDLTHHVDTPLLWPWRPGAIHALPWADDLTWTIAVNALAGIAFGVMAWRWVGR